MNRHALMHIPESRYCFPVDEENAVIRLRASKEDSGLEFSIIYGMKYDFHSTRTCKKLEIKYSDSLYNYYEIRLKLDDVRLVYIFTIQEDGKTYYFSEDGITEDYNFVESFYNCFQLPYINENDVMPTVEWMRNAVFYQIFVDRFNMGDDSKDKSYINMKWGELPTPKSHAGGDLRGIIDKIDYIDDLGISGIYLTPIFESTSNHKYDIKNYKKIDKGFGSVEDLKELVKKAHQKGIKVILDAVFNHCSFLMEQFQDVVRNGKDSRYFDWFLIHGDKVDQENCNYECFASCKYMPKLNTANKEVQDFLIDVATYWIDEADIDGWRLDVADEVSHEFWRRFRREVKAKKNDAVIIGENWHDAYPSLMGDQQDSIMNYAFTKTCLDYFARNRFSAKETAEKLNNILMRNMEQVNYMMLNLLDSHDTHRFFTEASCNKEKLVAAFALAVIFPGATCMYYGTEIATEGGYDPDSRRCFDWNKDNWDISLMDSIKNLIHLKRTEKILGYGDVSISSKNDLLIVKRTYMEHSITLSINMSQNYVDLDLDNAKQLIIGNVNDGKLSPMGYCIYKD